MSIFKTLGNKLKRVVSLNNLTRAVTGNFTAIGADVTRVMTTTDPNKPANPESNVAMSTFSIPQPITDVLAAKDAQYDKNVQDSVASNPTVQKWANNATMIAIKAFWLKNKNWVIGAVLSILLFIVGWKLLKTGKHVARGRRTR